MILGPEEMSEAAPLTSSTSPTPVAVAPAPTETTTIVAERAVPAGVDHSAAVEDAAGVVLVAVVALAAAGVATVLWSQRQGRRWIGERVLRALQESRRQEVGDRHDIAIRQAGVEGRRRGFSEGYLAGARDRLAKGRGGAHLRLIRRERE